VASVSLVERWFSLGAVLVQLRLFLHRSREAYLRRSLQTSGHTSVHGSLVIACKIRAGAYNGWCDMPCFGPAVAQMWFTC